jgi:hypothetical protein
MEKNTKVDKVSNARRNLIKASAAVPIIATLHPGAAMAASSAFQCTGGDFSNKKFVANGNSINGDTAVRMEVPFYQRTSAKSAITGCDSDSGNYPKKLYEIDGLLYSQNGNTHIICNDVLSNHYETDTAHVLVLFDVDTNYVSELGPWPMIQLIEDGGSGTALNQSCWTSVGGLSGGL